MSGTANYGINNLYPKPTIKAGAGGAALLQTLSVTSGAAVQFAAFDPLCSMVFFDIQTGNVFVTFDGSTPSSSNGSLLVAGTNYTWSKAAATVAKFIASSTTASLTAHQFSI